MLSIRWSTVRVVWLRELKDQLRDRRTLMMILLLPLVLYPLGGLGLTHLALGVVEENHTIGIIGAKHLPQPSLKGSSPLSLCLALLPSSPQTALCGAERFTTAAVTEEVHRKASHPYPPLLDQSPDRRIIFSTAFVSLKEQESLQIELLPRSVLKDPKTLNSGRAQVLLVVPPRFQQAIQQGRFPELHIVSREGDESAQRASRRLLSILYRWQVGVKEARFTRSFIPNGFDVPFLIKNSEMDKPVEKQTSEKLLTMLLRIFPFILVMWSLAGALYPAVDLCAGEKERGTMETLLISPAQREEIVVGKFLAIWVFSGVTALLNLLSMAFTVQHFSGPLGGSPLQLMGVVWCIILILPLSAFFSAISLAVGAYARSTKEGQYYLMPLFLVTMPLVFLTMVPGITLSPLTSLIPVTGVSLLLQKLLTADNLSNVPWLFFLPVLAPIVVYSWLALRWAIEQFKREEVLFREAERFDFNLWLRRLLREKEPRPSSGQALFCFSLILGFTWFTLGMGEGLIVTQTVRYLAFVATPALGMAFILTTQPRESLAIRLPPWWSWPVALALVLLLLPCLAQITLWILQRYPVIYQWIEDNQAFTTWLAMFPRGTDQPTAPWLPLIAFAWLPALCEELAFRGFILTGLQRRFRPRTAVLLSSFLFALFHLNVFQFVPTFLLGLVLAYLTTRCGSILPSILFHMLYNTLVLLPALFPEWLPKGSSLGDALGGSGPRVGIAAVCATLAGGLLLWLTKHQPHRAYRAFLRSDPGMKKEEEGQGE